MFGPFLIATRIASRNCNRNSATSKRGRRLFSPSTNGHRPLGVLRRDRYHGKKAIQRINEAVPQRQGLGIRLACASNMTQSEEPIVSPTKRSLAGTIPKKATARDAANHETPSVRKKIGQEKRPGGRDGSGSATMAAGAGVSTFRSAAGSIALLHQTPTTHRAAGNLPQEG